MIETRFPRLWTLESVDASTWAEPSRCHLSEIILCRVCVKLSSVLNGSTTSQKADGSIPLYSKLQVEVSITLVGTRLVVRRYHLLRQSQVAPPETLLRDSNRTIIRPVSSDLEVS